MRIFIVLCLVIFCLLLSAESAAQLIRFEDSWGEQGYTLAEQSASGVKLLYSITEFNMETMELDGAMMKKIGLSGQLIPRDEGMPDLPAESRFIALPSGAEVSVAIISSRLERFFELDVMPAPRLPLDTDSDPLEYRKNEAVYARNEFYPQSPLLFSEVTQIRGVDAVIVSVSPFQYNPVTREMLVHRDLEIQVNFRGGSGQFGEERLRSIWWEPILKGALINYESLPTFQINKTSLSRTEDYEYIIISPDDPAFLAWADSISVFRNLQGIRTGVVTTTETGGNTPAAIETYINNAYNTWDIPPAAVLLLGDYGTTGSTIVSPIWNNYCVSDHIYADVTGNNVADVVLARITAQNENHLQTMITKFLDYERNPITDSGFYDHPITALGWQTERWFQICAETIGGYWYHQLGKNRVRINAVYEGNPNVDPWSTYSNTYQVLNYFGPNGQGYIPQTPAQLGGWTGGNGTMINQALENGAFMLVHRDHGGETGWGEPDYTNTYINMLNNDKPVFVFSINCLTGKYNITGECFAEKFHRHPVGALGLVAASEVSYSFVNDSFMWGTFDHMWPGFMPNQGTYPTDCDFILPAFANAAGKLFLMYNSWPNNNTSKPVTYNLFHHHGDAFLNVYSEVPQNLTVTHASELISGLTEFVVTADAGSFIGLSVNGEVIGSAVGTGSAVAITIPVQLPSQTMIVTVTKQNHFRYNSEVSVIASGQYVIFDSVEYIELDGHLDNSIQSLDTVRMDVTLRNIGLQPTGNLVNAVLSTASTQVMILDNLAQCSQIPAASTFLLEDAFRVEFLPGIEDHTFLNFQLDIESNGEYWQSFFTIEVLAPVLAYNAYELNVLTGADNILDPGEAGEITILCKNNGSGYSYNSAVVISSSDPNLNITGVGLIPQIDPGEIAATEQPFTVSVDSSSPAGYFALIDLIVQDESTLNIQDQFFLPIGFLAHTFEAGEGDWTHAALGDDWLDEWHLSSYRNHTVNGSFSMKCGGQDGGVYSNFIFAALAMPEMELGSNSSVKFHHWMHVGANNNGNTWDGGLIEISVNGGDWEQITPLGGYPCVTLNLPTSPFPAGTPVFAGQIDWEEVELDLSSYTGTAQLRFVLGSTGLVTYEGWYIDDVYFSNPTGTSDETIIALSKRLFGNYPNPFNPETEITFSTTESTEVTEIVIYNLKGQKIKTLLNEILPAGHHSVIWNGTDAGGKAVSSGVYLYRMRSGSFSSTRKMILLK